MLQTLMSVPRKIYREAKFLITPKKDVLVYLGLHKGEYMDYIYKNYRTCYGFEANPTLFKALKEKYKKYPHVHIIHAAVADHDGEIEFNISDNEGASSSIGHFDSKWPNKIKMIQTIKVPCINLINFLNKENIHHISDYISDIQGMGSDGSQNTQTAY